jgi:glycosyltransferase involved in cell wall biosynthesis
MVVLNEEKTVREALKSVKWMDEIIVVDALSTDKTVKICQEYQAKIFSREWSAEPDQKNFAIQQASSDWVFLLDADERVRPQFTTEH